PNFDMIVNYPIARSMQRHIEAIGLDMPAARPEPPSGSTDWGNISYLMPSVETSYPILDRVCTWHSQDVVDASNSELGYANTLKIAKAMALTGIDLLSNPELLATAKAEFAREKKARQS
ncbi:MAG: hypothetical protein ACR2J8_11525, partial [Thermomicrobiales bacterium]